MGFVSVLIWKGMGVSQSKEIRKNHSNQCQGEDQLWKHHYPNTAVIIKSDDKEATSFQAPEATGEIFNVAEEQSFHRSLAKCLVR